MAERKTERLMNLIFLLLSTRQFLTKEQIRTAIDDYRSASDEAFNRTFERDKAELRVLGVPLEIGTFDPLHEDVQGYRIPRDAAELPDLELTPDEAAVIGVAARMWEHAGFAARSGDALLKLKAAGIEVDTTAVPLTTPTISAGEATFDDVWEAVSDRHEIVFDYGRAGETTERRRLQPWGVLSWRGRWYVGGHDVDRDAPRLFRLSRIRGAVTRQGAAGAFTVPEGASVRELAASFASDEPAGEALLHVRAERALPLRRHALSVEPLDDRTDTVRVAYRSSWELASMAASFAPDVVVVEPVEVRDLTVELLRGVLEAPA